MKMLLAISFIFCACYVEEPNPEPYPPTYIPGHHYQPDTSFCGDDVCDGWRGEDAWWCVDCGYDYAIGGPSDGGFCGDGVCFGYEDEYSCWDDCRPTPFYAERNPGWIDPPAK